MTLNFDPVTQSQWEIWKWLYSKISSWNTNAPGGNKVKILQIFKPYTCSLTPPKPQWAYDVIDVWATRRWTYIALCFEYFETTQNLDTVETR